MKSLMSNASHKQAVRFDKMSIGVGPNGAVGQVVQARLSLLSDGVEDEGNPAFDALGTPLASV